MSVASKRPSLDTAAFSDGLRQPKDADLEHMLGPAREALADLDDTLRASHPELTRTWKFSSMSGWHLIAMRRKRRIYYLVPAHHDFLLSVVVGDRAVNDLRRRLPARDANALLAAAEHYPEGTVFRFSRKDFDLQRVAAVIEAKIAN